MKLSLLLLLLVNAASSDGLPPPQIDEPFFARSDMTQGLSSPPPLPSSFRPHDQIVYQDNDVVIRTAPGERKFDFQESSSFTQGRGHRDPVVQLSMARDEIEGFHLVITPVSKQVQVNNLKISKLRDSKSGQTLAPENFEVHQVGYIWDKSKSDGGQHPTPFADVLFPDRGSSAIEPYRNHNYYVTLSTPSQKAAGLYEGNITLSTQTKTIQIPLRVKLWNYNIPTVKSVNTQLFEVDPENIYYTYNLDPWSAEAQRLISELFENLAKNRISPAKTPAIAPINWAKFPTQEPGFKGKGLKFTKDSTVRLAGPKFDALEKGFSVSFYLKPTHSDFDFNLSHFWQSSGYELAVTPQNTTAKVGAGREQSQNKVVAIQTSSGLKPDWNQILLSYDKRTLRLYLNGQLQASKPVNAPMQPSMRVLDLKGNNILIDQVQWFDRALSQADAQSLFQGQSDTVPGSQTVHSYHFDEALYRFQDNKSKTDETANTLQWETWVQRNGLWLNDIKASLGGSPMPSASGMKTRLSLQSRARAYVNLPHDESFDGLKSEKNKQYARAVRKLDPKIRRLQTFGAMAGRNRTTQQKLSALRSHIGFVEIWSARPVILERFPKFFEARLKRGESISPYIHHTESIEDPLGLMNSRLFFWKLYAKGLDSCTYWFMNLWNYPMTRNGARPQKQTIPTELGFMTTRRNNTSVASGSILWPGKDKILFSLRTEGWRDGMEDFERFKLLDSFVKDKKQQNSNRALVQRAEKVLQDVRTITNDSTPRWEFRSPASPQTYHSLRQAAGDLIEAFSESSP